jgi:hypothetical protein
VVDAGIIRHMRPTRDGNVPIHQSSISRIILTTLSRPAATQWAPQCAGRLLARRQLRPGSGSFGFR